MTVVVSEKKVTIQGGRTINAKAGELYHVVTRSHEFGNKEWTAELESIQTLDTGSSKFDFLHFKGFGARDFTIAEMTLVVDITPSWAAIVPVLLGVLQNDEAPASAKAQVEREVRRMALIADRYVRAVGDGLITPQPEQGDTVAMSPMLTDPDIEEVTH